MNLTSNGNGHYFDTPQHHQRPRDFEGEVFSGSFFFYGPTYWIGRDDLRRRLAVFGLTEDALLAQVVEFAEVEAIHRHEIAFQKPAFVRALRALGLREIDLITYFLDVMLPVWRANTWRKHLWASLDF
jgi:hypothetical protein